MFSVDLQKFLELPKETPNPEAKRPALPLNNESLPNKQKPQNEGAKESPVQLSLNFNKALPKLQSGAQSFKSHLETATTSCPDQWSSKVQEGAEALSQKIATADAELFEYDKLISQADKKKAAAGEECVVSFIESLSIREKFHTAEAKKNALKIQADVLKQTCQGLQDSVVSLSSKTSRLEETTAKFLQDCEAMQRGVQEKQDKEKHAMEEEYVKKSQEKKLFYEKQLQKLLEKLRVVKSTNEAKKRKIDQILQDLRSTEAHKSSLINEIRSSENEIVQLEKNFAQCVNEFNNAKLQLQSIRSDYGKQKEENTREQQEETSKQTLLKEKIDQSKEKVEALKTLQEKAHQELLGLKLKEDDICVDLDSTENRHSENTILIQTVKKAVAQLKEQLAELQREEAVQEANIELTAYFTEKFQKSSESVEDIASNYRQLFETRHETLLLNDDAKTSSQTKNARLAEEIEATKARLKELEDQCSTKLTEVDSLKEMIEKHEKDRENCQQENGQTSHDLRLTKKLEQEISCNENEVNSMEKNYKDTEGEIGKIKSEIVALNEEEGKLEAEYEQLVNEQEKEKMDLLQKEENQKKQKQQLLEKKEALMSQLDAEKNELKAAEDRQAEIASKRQKMKATRQLLIKAEQERAALTKAEREKLLQDAKAEIEEAKLNADKLVKKITDCKNNTQINFKRIAALQDLVNEKKKHVSVTIRQQQKIKAQKDLEHQKTAAERKPEVNAANGSKADLDICAQSPVLSNRYVRSYARKRTADKSPAGRVTPNNPALH